MYNILVSKAKCVPDFKHALMDSGTSYLVEATSDLFWGCGLNAELATTPHFKYYLRYNVLGYVLSKVRTSLTEPSTNDASAIRIATNHPDETDVTTRTYDTLDKEISVINPHTVPDNLAHSPSSNVPEFDHKSEVITTPEPTAQSTDLDITTPSTQTPDATTDDNLPQNRALTPLLTSEPEDSNEQFITPLLTLACSSRDLRDVGHSHDVLSKQLFSALSGLISASKGSPKVVLLVYRPPKTSICDFTVGLNVILDILSKENKHIFIIGDFNIDVSKPNRCGKATQDFTNLLLSYSHFPLIHKPTRIVKSSASLIDNMYTNYTYDSCNCGILCSDVSDHFPVFCIIDCLSMTDKKSNTVTKRNFNCKNIAKFSRKLSSQNWNNVYNVDDSQMAFSVLQRVIDQLIEDIFPEQTIPLKAAIKARNSLSNLCKQNPTDKELHKNYKLNRNQVTAQIRNAHITYQSNEFDIVKNDISKSWNVLKAIIGLQSSKKTQNMSYIVNNKHITDSYDISNAFNNCFASIGSELAGNITSSINPLSYLKSVQNSMFMPKVSENEVKNIFMSFKNSAAEWDNFPTFVAKQCVDSYISPLTYILNRAIIQGIFPSELKIARIIPIFKSGDKQNVSNYRPISILTFFAKVFEKILYNNISKFLDRNGTIHENQFGFRKGHSTNQAFITLIDKITKSVDNGDIAINIFIDLKKAFYTVSHEILLKKLFNYGIRGNVLQLCESYLINRYQYVTFNGTKSLHKRVTCGVPQGSILGLLIFLAYMNDIYDASQFLYNILYADDTCIYLSGNELSKLIKSMNSEIKLISDWLKANKLTLNIDKTYYMVFHRGRRKCFGNTELFIDNIKIKQTETMKYMGAIIDIKLNWISHITVVKSCSQGNWNYQTSQSFVE